MSYHTLHRNDRANLSAFTVAILVTPMGSISVVVAAILSHYFLKESLTFFVSRLSSGGRRKGLRKAPKEGGRTVERTVS